jgi:hypothetical protein
MPHRARLTPLVLLLAVMVSPAAAGTARPAESLRLVVGIAWQHDDGDDQARSLSDPSLRRPVLASERIRIGCDPDSRALGSPFHRARFQRPPPARAL